MIVTIDWAAEQIGLDLQEEVARRNTTIDRQRIGNVDSADRSRRIDDFADPKRDTLEGRAWRGAWQIAVRIQGRR